MNKEAARQFNDRARKLSRAQKWGGVFILLALAAQGMPISGELSDSVIVRAADKRQLTVAKITKSNPVSISKGIYWAALYVGSMLFLLYRGFASAKRVISKQQALVALFLLVPFSIIWSSYPKNVVINSVHALGGLMIVVAGVVHYGNAINKFVRDVGLVLGINVIVHLVAVVVLPESAIDGYGRWKGLSSHANTLGYISFCALWANVASLAIDRRPKYIRNSVLIILSLIAVTNAQSATAIVSMLIVGLGPFLLKINFVYFGQKLGWQLVAFVMLALTALVVPAYLLNQELIGLLTGTLGRSQDFTGRTDIWAAGIDALIQRPILGWSFDNHAEVIKSTTMVFNTYHNGYIALALQGGLLALILLAIVIVKYFLTLPRSSVDFVIVSLPFILASLIVNIVETGFMEFRQGVWMIMLFLMISAVHSAKQVPHRNAQHKKSLNNDAEASVSKPR